MKPAARFGWLRTHGRNLGMLIALGLALSILAVFSPKYLTVDNFIVVALQMAFIGIAALGTTSLVVSARRPLNHGWSAHVNAQDTAPWRLPPVRASRSCLRMKDAAV